MSVNGIGAGAWNCPRLPRSPLLLMIRSGCRTQHLGPKGPRRNTVCRPTYMHSTLTTAMELACKKPLLKSARLARLFNRWKEHQHGPGNNTSAQYCKGSRDNEIRTTGIVASPFRDFSTDGLTPVSSDWDNSAYLGRASVSCILLLYAIRKRRREGKRTSTSRQRLQNVWEFRKQN